MPAAIIGGVVAGAGAIGAAAIGSGAQKKASQQATDASREATAANNALQREIYGENKATLSPYVQRGNAAGNQINALLGLGGSAPVANAPSPAAPAPLPAPNALAAGGAGDWLELWQRGQGIAPGPVSGYGGGTFNPDGTPVTTGGNGTPSVPVDPSQAANSAFDVFRNSTGYQFRLGEGMNALNSGYAGAGTIQSGAAMKAAQRYGQDFASNEFGNYMGYLGNQQGVGLSGASALAGVGQGYANNISSQNNAQASVIANSALARGQGQAQLWGGIGNAFGQIGGVIAGRNY